jgi:hypothetical protein
VLLNDANIFLTYALYLFDEIEKSASVLERISSKRREKDEEKIIIYILLSFAIEKKKEKRKESFLYSCNYSCLNYIRVHILISRKDLCY